MSHLWKHRLGMRRSTPDEANTDRDTPADVASCRPTTTWSVWASSPRVSRVLNNWELSGLQEARAIHPTFTMSASSQPSSAWIVKSNICHACSIAMALGFFARSCCRAEAAWWDDGHRGGHDTIARSLLACMVRIVSDERAFIKAPNGSRTSTTTSESSLRQPEAENEHIHQIKRNFHPSIVHMLKFVFELIKWFRL